MQFKQKKVTVNSVEIGSRNNKICEVYSYKFLKLSVGNKLE